MKQSGLGIVSLILGIIGMLLSIIWIGIIPCIISVILAIIVLIKKDVKHGLAIAGLTCSIIGIIIVILIDSIKPAEAEIITMNLGQKESINELIEFTPEKTSWELIIHPSKEPLSSYSYRISDETMSYLLKGTLKNIGSKELNLGSAFEGILCINDQYEFNIEVRVESKDGKSFDYLVQPLQEKICYVYADIPYEVYEVAENCTISFSVAADADDFADFDTSNTIYSITTNY